jgi:hypothetical protein
MNITAQNISRFEVIENNRPDDRVIIAELAGDLEGTLIFDNAGATLTEANLETVAEAYRNNEELDAPTSSTTVSGIAFRNDYSAGWVCENTEE